MRLFRERNGRWRGGRYVDPRGYVLINVGRGHPLADCRGYAYEHRLIAYAAGQIWHGSGHVVHHLDGRKSRNDRSNLAAISPSEHASEHRGARGRFE
jgi:hypothetical protein